MGLSEQLAEKVSNYKGSFPSPDSNDFVIIGS
jgi:hypothetical protein